MNPIISVFFLVLVLLQSRISAQNLIASSCKSITRADPNVDYGFCATSLQAAPASGCATLRGLGMISIRLIRYNITDTRCHIKQLLRSRKWDPYVKQCLGDCLDLFSDAIPAVKQAMRHYNGKRFDDANILISSIMDASTTCEDAFAAVASPISKRNRDAFQLSAVALSVMRLIQWGSA